MFKKALKYFKRDLHSIPLGIKLIVLVIFLRTIGWGFIDPFYSIYLKQFSENYTVVGLFTALMSVTALITIIPLMRLADRVKEATIIRDGEVLYFFVVVSLILAGILISLPLLIFSLLLMGIAQTFVVVGTEAYIRKHNGHGKSGPFGYYVALDYLGWIIGMLIAAFTIQYYGFNWMFLFVLPSIFLSFLILPRIRERGVRSLLKGFKRYFHNGKDLLSIFEDCRLLDPKVIFFLVISFFDGMLRMFSFIFIPLFALSIDLSLKQIALLMVVMYLPFVFSFFISELSDRMKKMNVIAMGLFISAISFVLLYFIVDQMWVIILAAITSLSMAIIRPANNGAITRLTPRRMLGEVTGYNNFIDRAGRIVGPILAGFVADIYGLSITFLIIAIISLSLGMLSLALKGYELALNPEE
jgi:MFS family permease